jgi:hypothetical protein
MRGTLRAQATCDALTAANWSSRSGDLTRHTVARGRNPDPAAPTHSRKINLGRDELNAPCLRVTAPERPPGIKPDDELRSTQQHLRTARLVELNLPKHRLGTVPTPAQSKLRETNIQPGLHPHEMLERGSMLRYPGASQLVCEQDEHEDDGHTRSAQQGNPQPALGQSGRFRRRLARSHRKFL